MSTSPIIQYKLLRAQRVLLAVVVAAWVTTGLQARCMMHDGHRVCSRRELQAHHSHFDYGTAVDRNFSRPYRATRKRHTSNSSTATDKATMFAGSSTFVANMTGDVTSGRQRAINYCMERMSTEWKSNIAVSVLVRFEHFDSELLLGMAQPTSNWEVDGHICPIALAEAILSKDLNGDTVEDAGEFEKYEILMTLNSNAAWYEGTDAKPRSFTYDLVTVCMHEVYHGLFMSGGNLGIARGEDGVSYVAYVLNKEFSGRFESFMANQDGCSIDGYIPTPAHLGTALTGNNLWFAESGTRKARLHAPKPYVSGSSWYHLSEVEYGSGGDNNDLMTPVIGSSYAQHNAGPLVRAMQVAVTDVRGRRGAGECTTLNDPVVGNMSVGGGGAVGSPGGNAGSGGNGEGFVVRLGDMKLSGWILVGAGVGAVALIAGIVMGVRYVAMSGGRDASEARPARRVGAEDQVQFSEDRGNGGGIV